MAERSMAAVLKTVSGVTHSGVRIPLPPPDGHPPLPALPACGFEDQAEQSALLGARLFQEHQGLNAGVPILLARPLGRALLPA